MFRLGKGGESSAVNLMKFMDSEFEGAFEAWDGCWIADELDGSGLAGCPLDEAALFQAAEHGTD